ncbi:MAG: D-sedoheptulose 7-phosphate isomerase [Acidobacteriota bacterium]|jgi:D-sedoheptulose 7-phosphate isomerase|nr:D-sedoheptulose 7-phosphate isomerase [Acidobacteriota bacterium]
MSKAASEDFSRAFYPFLHENNKKPQDMMEDLRFSLMEKVRESVEVKSKFFEENKDTILAASLQMAKAFKRGRKLLVCGNGGSATDAQHIAVEFMHPITVGRKALPAICLSNDMAMITAVANDVGFDDVFSRQIIALASEGDILLGISTSGNSENLGHAFATARRMKLTTIGYAGGDGGKMAQLHNDGLLDFCMTVPTSSVHRIQESHVTLYHIMWDMVHTFLQNKAMVESEV